MKTRKGMKKPKRYWKDVNNRRQFFCEFAQRKGFDPHDVDNWANVTRQQVVAAMEVFAIYYLLFVIFLKSYVYVPNNNC